MSSPFLLRPLTLDAFLLTSSPKSLRAPYDPLSTQPSLFAFGFPQPERLRPRFLSMRGRPFCLVTIRRIRSSWTSNTTSPPANPRAMIHIRRAVKLIASYPFLILSLDSPSSCWTLYPPTPHSEQHSFLRLFFGLLPFPRTHSLGPLFENPKEQLDFPPSP